MRQYGLKVLAEGIQNNKENSTRFIVISKELIIPENSDKVSLCLFLPHEKSALYNVLGRFGANGLSLTKIESRPMAGLNFQYLFYLGHFSELFFFQFYILFLDLLQSLYFL